MYKVLDVELRGDFPRVSWHEPKMSWRTFCSIHRANARVRNGKLQPLAGDQSDRGKAQDYRGGGKRGERG